MITSIILALHFLGFVSLESAYLSLYFVALVLFVAEIAVVSFGMLALNGFLALFAAYSLHLASSMFFGTPIGWSIIFGIAFVEFSSLFIFIMVWKKLKNIKTDTGAEGMVGQMATIVNWNGLKGTVRYEGEIWKAESKKEMDLNKDDEVSIETVGKMKLIITA